MSVLYPFHIPYLRKFITNGTRHVPQLAKLNDLGVFFYQKPIYELVMSTAFTKSADLQTNINKQKKRVVFTVTLHCVSKIKVCFDLTLDGVNCV